MFNKKTVLALAMSISMSGVTASALAVVAGPYIGGQLGWGDIHTAGVTNSDVTSPIYSVDMNATITSTHVSGSDTGLAGRLFAGYQFNPNWAVELGYTKFSNMNTKGSASGIAYGVVPITDSLSGTVKTNAIDLVGKGILPLQNNFSLYGKLGAAYLTQKMSASGSITALGTSIIGSAKSTAHKIYPTFGLGAAYDITQNVVADLSWNRIQKTGSSSLSSTDLVSAGLSYHFG